MSEGASASSDRQQIVDITHNYCWALDRNQWHELDDVFVPDATATLGTRVCANREEIKQVVSRALTPLDDSQHIVATHQVRVDGDAATSFCYLHAQHIRHDAVGGPHWVVGGRYEDRFIRTPDGWRITHRDLIVMWTEGNLAVVRP